MNSAPRTVTKHQSDMEEGLSVYTFFSGGFNFIKVAVMKAVATC